MKGREVPRIDTIENKSACLRRLLELYHFPETIGAIGRAALLRRRAWWPRSSAALPFAKCADFYSEMV